MKLYTEEQIKRMLTKAWTPSHFGGFLYNKRQLLEGMQPIKLPSDEEIENYIEKTLYGEKKYYFKAGVEFMKEQILNQNK